MMKKALAAMVMSGMMASAHADYLVKEGFENVGTLAGNGWVLNNMSSPAGVTGWYQGDQQAFSAKSGAPNGYIAANYNNAAAGGTLANWLITPEFSVDQGAIVSFWARAGAADGYSDMFSFGFSNGGIAPANFTMSSAETADTDGWVRYEARFEKGLATGNARFGLLYTGEADFANYIGFDNLSISAIPEPSSMLILGAGVMGLVAARRRKRG
ncbi:choice-of-anchor J domain-containing protein [Massilia sp. BKSP1R2A-1]|uniref:choice-of-anchor J domain-containing protein n=1 Tax=Massilia sp. BKSP1R2A-1 TaxID=3422595 RepID=UPI003D325AA3